MGVEALARDMISSGGGNDFTDPPPPEVFFPDGDDDDYYSIQDSIDRLELHANTDSDPDPEPPAKPDELPPGTEWRGYEFRDLSKTNRMLGDVATTGFDRRLPISDYGMPRLQTRNRIRALALGQRASHRIIP